MSSKISIRCPITPLLHRTCINTLETQAQEAAAQRNVWENQGDEHQS